MKKHYRFLALAAVLPLVAAAGLQVTPRAAAKGETAKPIKIPFKEFKLKNGLRVIMSEDHTAPTYSIDVTYNAGSRDERKGRTGFAHLFEHMMYQGSENVGKGEHFFLIDVNGGSMNGNTTEDRTTYFETLPANQLDLGLFVEADRMKSLVINQANLDNQRNAVQEERRLGVDNSPYGKTFEAISETAYDNFAYQHSVIGSMDDLNAATIQDVTDFFRTYYAPNNAVLTLVGDFKTDEALAKVKKYFEAIPLQPAPPVPDMTEPEQKAERRATVEDQFARLPRIDILYKMPAGDHPDFYALSLLGRIMGSGNSSRIYQKLVKEQEIASAVIAAAQEKRGPSLFLIAALSPPGKNSADIEKLIYAEIDRLKNEPVADWELEKVKMTVRRQRAQQLQSTLGRSLSLGQYAVFYGNANLINEVEDKYNRVTKEDIQRVARTYFKDTSRTVVITVPKPRGTKGE